MFRKWMNKPLTMSLIGNCLFYSFLIWVTNNLVNFLFVSPETPEGITGREGFAVFITIAIFISYICSKENDWVRDLNRSRTG